MKNTTPSLYRYSAFGLSIESGIELPGLSPASGDLESETIIQIAYGQVPSELPGSTQVGVRARVNGNQALLRIEGVAAFYVNGGSQVTIEEVTGSDSANIRHFLFGLAFGVLFVQRGMLAMHASAVEINGNGIAFIGRSGIGKSTFAAYLHRRGHRLICDDACVIEETNTAMQTWSGIPHHKLWGESLEVMGATGAGLRNVQPGLEKYYVPTAVIEPSRPIPLRALYVIHPTESGAPTDIIPIKGLAALELIRQNVHGREFHHRINGEKQFLDRCMAIQRRLPIYSMPVPRGFHLLAETRARLESHVAINSSPVQCA